MISLRGPKASRVELDYLYPPPRRWDVSDIGYPRFPATARWPSSSCQAALNKAHQAGGRPANSSHPDGGPTPSCWPSRRSTSGYNHIAPMYYTASLQTRTHAGDYSGPQRRSGGVPSLLASANTAPSYSVYPDLTANSLRNDSGAQCTHHFSVAFRAGVVEGADRSTGRDRGRDQVRLGKPRQFTGPPYLAPVGPQAFARFARTGGSQKHMCSWGS